LSNDDLELPALEHAILIEIGRILIKVDAGLEPGQIGINIAETILRCRENVPLGRLSSR